MSDGTTKQDEIKRVASMVSDHRLDYVEAIAMAFDVLPKYDPAEHDFMSHREFFRMMCPNEFARIKNAKVAVEAFGIFLSERQLARP